MTHDEMTAALRGADSFVLDEGDDAEIADRLDRYWRLLRRCLHRLPDNFNLDDATLKSDIREALK